MPDDRLGAGLRNCNSLYLHTRTVIAGVPAGAGPAILAILMGVLKLLFSRTSLASIITKVRLRPRSSFAASSCFRNTLRTWLLQVDAVLSCLC
jgi:hypothetical protein